MIYLYLIAAIAIVYFIFKRSTGLSADLINKLVKKSASWATTAQQDQSPLKATVHANYAVGYLWAIKEISTEFDIQKASGINLKQFEEHILNVQEMVTKKVTEACPKFAGDVDLYLSTIAGEVPTTQI